MREKKIRMTLDLSDGWLIKIMELLRVFKVIKEGKL